MNTEINENKEMQPAEAPDGTEEFVPTIEESIMASGLHRQGDIELGPLDII